MEINEILKEKLENNLEVIFYNRNIFINVTESEVTLKGIVNSSIEKNKIETIVWNTYGVQYVNNELSICKDN
jgi:osmotically-inducible protein OsmY